MSEIIEETYHRIKEAINLTPVMQSTTLNKLVEASCYLKMESFQKTGSFKFRGAFNAVSCLSAEQKEKGVITHSSGNYAQALSLASTKAGVYAIIVMPENAPKTKIAATKEYGAEVVFCGSKPGDREEAAQKLIEQHNYTLIHPSDNLNVIYGQGTAVYELIKEKGDFDYILAPCGGGGILSGTALATKWLSKNTKVFGVEPKNADDAYRSYKEGKIFPSINPKTIADGLRTQLGPNTFRIIRENVDDMITVTEEEIVDAMEFLWTRMKLVVEPSGAVSLAGVLSNQLDLKSKKVGIIISGGNIDTTDFFDILRKRIR